jgi:hypothetical protein
MFFAAFGNAKDLLGIPCRAWESLGIPLSALALCDPGSRPGKPWALSCNSQQRKAVGVGVRVGIGVGVDVGVGVGVGEM